MDELGFEKWVQNHDGEDHCKYCILTNECPHGMACYGGAPIEPQCCYKDLKELLDIDAIIADMEEDNE